MPDNRTNRGPQDSNRININEPYEIEYWANKWNVATEQLKACIQRVGPMVEDIKRCLGK